MRTPSFVWLLWLILLLGFAGTISAQAPPAAPVAVTPASQPERPIAPVGAPTSAAGSKLVFDPVSERFVLVSTDQGDMVFELAYERAPMTVRNFLTYVDERFYEGTVFHRVLRDSVIQGGGMLPDMSEKKGNEPILNESGNGLLHKRGAIAMARRRMPDSATSQFFISVADNPNFDLLKAGRGYAVFGKVVAGMAVVDAIRVLEVRENGASVPEMSRPLHPPVIRSVKRLSPEQAKPFILAEANAATNPPAQPAVEPPLIYALLSTGKGDVLLELNRSLAPTTVDNFISYVKQRYYDGTVFHRVLPGFIIQGGGYADHDVMKRSGRPIPNEWTNGLKNIRGAIAMARVGGRPDSATSQFFINLKNNPNFDQANDGAAYAVFGRVVTGMDVVDALGRVPVEAGEGGEMSKPVEVIKIKTLQRISQEEAAKLIAGAQADSSPASPAPAHP
jgi:peptidyl-prolyl cis-trans isomerase A (cyclophilin A)